MYFKDKNVNKKNNLPRMIIQYLSLNLRNRSHWWLSDIGKIQSRSNLASMLDQGSIQCAAS